ncbi:MAG: leucine-rich repeat protein [Kiritimatiellia bacterium]|nr:leucine-rich repeat protein [Kiritimatiellia bacterium]
MKMRLLTGAVVAGMLSASTLSAAWTATGTANEYTDGYWTITRSGNTLSKVVAGGEVAADLDLTTFEADTGVKINRVGGEVCTSPLIASFTGPDVVHLDTKAFYKNTGITNLVLSSEWHQAWSYSEQFLNGCTNLENLEPKVIKWTTWSGPNLICNCPKLTIDVEFPLIEKICGFRGVFAGAGFTSVSMPLYLGGICSRDEMFMNCKSLTRIDLPKAGTVEREFAKGCSSLEEVYMPSCTNFGYTGTFDGCSKLRKITIGKTLNKLPSSFLNGCTSLVSIEPFLPEGITDSGYDSGHFSWCGQGFQNCSSLEQPLVIKAPKLGKLEYKLFSNCAKISDITLDLPALTNIGIQVFGQIAAGAQIKWLSPNAPETIDASAFYPRDGANPTVILLRSREAATAWRKHCTRVRVPQAGETALTANDLALASYPGDRTIGLIDVSWGSKAWIVRDWVDGTVILMR